MPLDPAREKDKKNKSREVGGRKEKGKIALKARFE
jgi:hypothetical protein